MPTFLIFHPMLSCSAPTNTSTTFRWKNRWFSHHLQPFMVNLKKYLVSRISGCKLWIPMDGPRYVYCVLDEVSVTLLSALPIGLIFYFNNPTGYFLCSEKCSFFISLTSNMIFLFSFSLKKLLEIFRKQSQIGELYYWGTSTLLGLMTVVELVKIQRVSQTISCHTYSK